MTNYEQPYHTFTNPTGSLAVRLNASNPGSLNGDAYTNNPQSHAPQYMSGPNTMNQDGSTIIMSQNEDDEAQLVGVTSEPRILTNGGVNAASPRMSSNEITSNKQKTG